MMKMVNRPETGTLAGFSGGSRMTQPDSEQVPMHPDDFAGLMSWIAAKHFREGGDEKTCQAKPVSFGLIG